MNEINNLRAVREFIEICRNQIWTVELVGFDAVKLKDNKVNIIVLSYISEILTGRISH